MAAAKPTPAEALAALETRLIDLAGLVDGAAELYDAVQAERSPAANGLFPLLAVIQTEAHALADEAGRGALRAKGIEPRRGAH